MSDIPKPVKEHFYKLSVKWTGNKGEGTTNYRAYTRDHTISSPDKSEIFASADPAFLGDKGKYNPEEFLLAALSTCHMLWFLHLCADRGVIVVDYIDEPVATMYELTGGGGHFKDATLNPLVTVTDGSMTDKLDAIHEQANKKCFIANSMNFPVKHRGKSKVL